MLYGIACRLDLIGALVRPVMEYATTVWAPHTAQNCNKLQQVQRRAARFACCKYERTASVTSMMNDLKWESLETRRNSQRLTMFYRMQHNIVSITPVDYLVPVQPSRSKRSGHDQVYQVRSWQVCRLHPLPTPFISTPFTLSLPFPFPSYTAGDLEILPGLS